MNVRQPNLHGAITAEMVVNIINDWTGPKTKQELSDLFGRYRTVWPCEYSRRHFS